MTGVKLGDTLNRVLKEADDEALVAVMCTAAESACHDVGGAACGEMEDVMRAALLALREAGALR